MGLRGGSGRDGVNTKQQRVLALEAFLAGVANGGDSCPNDDDFEEIQKSVKVAFEHWWERHLAEKARS